MESPTAPYSMGRRPVCVLWPECLTMTNALAYYIIIVHGFTVNDLVGIGQDVLQIQKAQS